MAKWIRAEDSFFNLENIKEIYINQCHDVLIDGVLIKKCKTRDLAETYVKEFIAEHYIKTGRIN